MAGNTNTAPGAGLDSLGLEFEPEVLDSEDATDIVDDDEEGLPADDGLSLDDVEDADDAPEDGDSDDDSVEDVDEDFRIQVPVRNLDQTEDVIELGADELSHLVTKGRQFDELYAMARQFEQQARQSAQLTQFAAQDHLVSQAIQLRARGLDERQVVQHLSSLFGVQLGAQLPNGESMDQSQLEEEFQNLDPDLERALQARLAKATEPVGELQKELERMRLERQQIEITQHNNQSFGQAVQALNVDFTGSDDDYRRLMEAAKELYPNQQLAAMKFSPRQAAAVLQQAGFKQRTVPVNDVKKKAAKVAAGKKAPKILSGKKTAGRRPSKPQPSQEGTTMSERAEIYKTFGL